MTMLRKDPDPLQTVVRFVCGALAGSLVGFWTGVRFHLPGFLPMIGITLVFCLVFAYCAVRYGDGFWYGLLK